MNGIFPWGCHGQLGMHWNDRSRRDVTGGMGIGWEKLPQMAVLQQFSGW